MKELAVGLPMVAVVLDYSQERTPWLGTRGWGQLLYREPMPKSVAVCLVRRERHATPVCVAVGRPR